MALKSGLFGAETDGLKVSEVAALMLNQPPQMDECVRNHTQHGGTAFRNFRTPEQKVFETYRKHKKRFRRYNASTNSY